MSLKDDFDRLEAIEVARPTVTTRKFKNLDAALDFCKWAEPDQLAIEKVYEKVGDATQLVEVVLQYVGSRGMN